MTVTMTPEVVAQLRAPFAKDHIGLLPKVTCKRCSDPKTVCDEHRPRKCPDCGNYISPSHIHISYVGHAETTDRLLQVDPEWTWEPLAFDATGLPQLDQYGGMWIRLTVAGVVRLGYGHADKRGGDAIKEAIGDAIRNAAMRFGVALDLWGAKFDKIPAERSTRKRKADDPPAEPVDETIPQPEPGARRVTQDQHKTMHLLWRDLNMGGEENRLKRLAVTAKLLGLADLNSSSQLTYEQADYVIERLRQRVSQVGAGA